MVEIIERDIFQGIAGRRPTEAPKYFILHNDAGSMSAKAYVPWLQSRYDNGQSELGFAHYYIDRNTIARVENTAYGAWSTANYDGNMNSIGYEVCQQYSASDIEFKLNEDMVLRQMAEDMKFYEVEPNYNTIKLHNEFSSTSCPARTMELHGGVEGTRNYIIERIKYFMSLGDTVQEMLDNETQSELVAGWVKNSVGWWYRNSDGSYPKNQWFKVNNEWFRFDANGYCLINKWFKDSSGKWAWLDARGSAVSSKWAFIEGKWYYFDSSCYMVTGWVKYGEHWFYLDSQNGDMISNKFIKHGEGWYFLNDKGERSEKEAFTIEPDGLITVKK